MKNKIIGSQTNAKYRKKPLKITLSVIASALLAYILICTTIWLIPLLTMNNTNATANDIELGNARLQELQSEVQVEYELPEGAKLYHFPCDNPTSNTFVLICPGGGYTACCLDAEGYSIAAYLNNLGIQSFVLSYRVGENSTYHAPLDDCANALTFIFDNADMFSVTNDYAMCGFSAGGNLIGLFGSSEWGYTNYNLPRPKLLIMGYPWLRQVEYDSCNLVHTCYYQILNAGGRKAFLGAGYSKDDIKSMDVTIWMDASYPPCYIIHGDSDTIVPCETSSRIADQKLTSLNVPHIYREYSGLNHGGGLYKGTIAENWLSDAVSYMNSL